MFERTEKQCFHNFITLPLQFAPSPLSLQVQVNNSIKTISLIIHISNLICILIFLYCQCLLNYVKIKFWVGLTSITKYTQPRIRICFFSRSDLSVFFFRFHLAFYGSKSIYFLSSLLLCHFSQLTKLQIQFLILTLLF